MLYYIILYYIILYNTVLCIYVYTSIFFNPWNSCELDDLNKTIQKTQVSTPSTSPTWIGLPVPKRSGLVKESSPSDTGTGNTDLVFTVFRTCTNMYKTCLCCIYLYIYIFLKIS